MFPVKKNFSPRGWFTFDAPITKKSIELSIDVIGSNICYCINANVQYFIDCRDQRPNILKFLIFFATRKKKSHRMTIHTLIKTNPKWENIYARYS